MTIVRRLTREQVLAMRQEALDSMRLTLEEYREMTADSCCISCARPSWDERYDAWDEVATADFLLGE